MTVFRWSAVLAVLGLTAGAATAQSADPPAAARRPVARESRQAAPQGAVRHDGHLAARAARPAVVEIRAADVRADARGAGALRRRARRGRREQGLSRRHRPVLAGRHAADHDARPPVGVPAAADRDLHDPELHEQPAHHLHGRPRAQRSRRRRAELERRVDRPLGRRYARRRHEVLPGAPPLARPGRREHSGQRRAAHRRAHSHDRERRDARDRIPR